MTDTTGSVLIGSGEQDSTPQNDRDAGDNEDCPDAVEAVWSQSPRYSAIPDLSHFAFALIVVVFAFRLPLYPRCSLPGLGVTSDNHA